MNVFKRFCNKIQYEFLKRIKPEMIGYRLFNSQKIRNTRLSNLSHISNKENIRIGNNVFVGHFNYIDGFGKVSIGNGVQITNYISVLTHSSHDSIRLYGEHYSEYHGKSMTGLRSGDVEIGEYSFIGPHSTIMPGSKIGKGSIVSAYSLVDGVFGDYSIIRGVPAKIVGNVRDRDIEYLKNNYNLRATYFDKDSSLIK
jgi:acetyltransferase-like isoleucine patch superfamily enzyme